MPSHVYLTQTQLDLKKLSKLIAVKFDRSGLVQNLQPEDLNVLPLADENWQKMRAAQQIMDLELESKDDFRNTLMRLYEVYSKPTLLFLGDLSSYSVQLQEGMLRLLEEPPHNLEIILFAQTRSQILPTIQSRVRFMALPERVVMGCLPEKLMESVKSKLPAAGEFTKSLIAATNSKISLPDLSKVEREELDFWLWQIQVNLTKLYEQKPGALVASRLERVLMSRKLNDQNLQKKLALSQIYLQPTVN